VSIQAGIWNFDGKPVEQQSLERFSRATTQHGPDGGAFHVEGSLGMLYRPFHTTKESLLELQPYVSPRNNVITWDGRLDNRDELLSQVDEYLTSDRSDPAIVAAAFDKWGSRCLAKIIGDWALVIWSPSEQTLILAKDFMGIRHLYYDQTPKRIAWCTTIEPLVLFADEPLHINEQFVLGYLASYPTARLTPYAEIASVPPCSYIRIKQGQHKIQRHWQFNSGKETRHRTDAEYEEHFRDVFKEAVRRRLRSHVPVMAELSGGMDSASIVCTADLLIGDGNADTPRLDTMSYYDDEEPNWNERPYFQKVEEKRGRIGTHINIVQKDTFVPLPDNYFVAVPGADQSALHFERALDPYMRAQGNRVVLSGIGGDEVLGGVPAAVPELADLLIQLRLVEFASKLKTWSIVQRQPWTHLLLKSLWSTAWAGMRQHDLSAELQRIPWLDQTFLKTHGSTPINNRIFSVAGCLPSQRSFLQALTHVGNQLALARLALVISREMRYPYLDRDLCEFLFSIPREQILRPAQRRSLMRRAMVGIVPPEILQRKRKAFSVRRVMTMYEELWPILKDRFHNSLSEECHFIVDKQFLHVLESTSHGQLSNLVRLNRTISLELWLRSLTARTRFFVSKSDSRLLHSRQTGALGCNFSTFPSESDPPSC
jgi:asparagine synthase (glutamine-hydrolysing)